ncbi:superfamily II DNA/RNA helicase [Leucobacter exalbidus]|uniref:Superfamily II DNA/RNA helicase n=1 Tax=Leucobacter exalbidus TaxID=662960 RepID=A0A940PXH9_9MICO|nr:DEAD/DEAH box helicase [Leucobacter exalbidus]MBP1327174.1 superfamily II DNA/RNA helicase [Leucobacter exalbidus]
MAKGRSGGFKPPANFEPGRNPRNKSSRFRDAAGKPAGGGKSRDTDGNGGKNGGAKNGGNIDRSAPRKSGSANVVTPRLVGGRPATGRSGSESTSHQSSERLASERYTGGKNAAARASRVHGRAVDPQKEAMERQRELHRAPLPEAVHTTVADAAGVTFADLGLGGNLVRVLGELGAETPFPVQVATIPDSIAGRNVLGRANTGSGKTIAFGAALVERMLKLKAEGLIPRTPKPAAAQRGVRGKAPAVRNPKALILAPTRELALQIDRTIQPLARSVGFYTAQLVGGVPIDSQIHALERGVDIIIGTPGRIQDLVDRRRLDLREVLVSVVDEADHMCELGFLEAVQKVLRQTVRGSQRLLFSATLDGEVADLVAEFLRDPAVHIAEERAPGNVDHNVLVVKREERDAVLVQLAKRRGRTMLFCRTRAYAEAVTNLLELEGVRAVELHGNLSQARRELNLEKFSTGKVSVLVATDVAARGIHVDGVDYVVQADPPADYKTYLHRTGRTGRAGSDGEATLLISRVRQARTDELLADAKITPNFFADFTPGDRLPRGQSSSR